MKPTRASRTIASFIGFFVALACSCGPAAPGASVLAIEPPHAGDCGSFDVDAFLRRHEKIYGTRRAVDEQLPRTFAFVSSDPESIERHSRRFTLARDAFRDEVLSVRRERYTEGSRLLEVRLRANGVDPRGAWALHESGTYLRLVAGELETAALAWALRRAYLDAPYLRTVSCSGQHLDLRFAAWELGDPTLSFDRLSFALEAVAWRRPNGTAAQVKWSGEGRSTDRIEPRPWWPTVWHEEAVRYEGTNAATPASCARLGPAEDTRAEGDDCLGAIDPGSAVDVPAGRVTTFPMTVLEGNALFRAGTTLFAFDPGVSTSALAPGAAAANVFRSNALPSSHGQLEQLIAGDLRWKELPVTSFATGLPPSLYPWLADRTSDVLLGWGAVSGLAVRLDYVKGEIAFAKDKTAWAKKEGTVLAPFVLAEVPKLAVVPKEVSAMLSDDMEVPSSTQRWLPTHAALARCSAIVVDIPRRIVSFEPPCHRPTRKVIGWVFKKTVSANDVASLVVEAVVPMTPAERAGIKKGDVLLEVGARPVRDNGFDALAPLGRHDAPPRFAVRVRRDGSTLEIEVDTNRP